MTEIKTEYDVESKEVKEHMSVLTIMSDSPHEIEYNFVIRCRDEFCSVDCDFLQKYGMTGYMCFLHKESLGTRRQRCFACFKDVG